MTERTVKRSSFPILQSFDEAVAGSMPSTIHPPGATNVTFPVTCSRNIVVAQCGSLRLRPNVPSTALCAFRTHRSHNTRTFDGDVVFLFSCFPSLLPLPRFNFRSHSSVKAGNFGRLFQIGAGDDLYVGDQYVHTQYVSPSRELQTAGVSSCHPAIGPDCTREPSWISPPWCFTPR